MQSLTPQQILQIKAEIARIHKRGSANYETLMAQVEKSVKPLQFNLAQLLASMASRMALWIFLEWARGAGKSTYLATHMRECAISMPRSSGILIGATYKQILTRTLPSTIEELERQGLFLGLHYFIGGDGLPRRWKWKRAYQPPNEFDRYIQFYNGSGIHLISQDVTGDGRGLNVDYEIGDESALLDGDKLTTVTLPTLRGSNVKAFINKRLFASRLHCSTTPLTIAGQWFTAMEEAAILTPEKIKFLKADSRINQENLRPGYLEDARLVTPPYIYDAEYLNIRMKRIKNGFYFLLDEKRHGYVNFNYYHYSTIGAEQSCKGDADLIPGKSIVLGIDWGAVFNGLVACQHLEMEFRALKNFYALGEANESQDDMCKAFCDYYEAHDHKVIHMWYDNTGNNKTGIEKRTRAERARDYFKGRGWIVHMKTQSGSNPLHNLKFMLWELILSELDPRMPRFRINTENCRELLVSMQNAGIIMSGPNEAKKDKSSERSKKIPQQFATHLSDAMDTPIFGLFAQLLRNFGGVLPESTIIKH
jgi:hypothetical protein